MKIEVRKTNSANALANATISKEILAKKEDQATREVAKNYKAAGFRQGKVPSALVKQRFGEKITEDARNQTLREVVQNALKELEDVKEKIIGDPIVSKFSENENGLDVEIKFSLRPQIPTDEIKSLIPPFAQPEVSDEEVNKRVNDLVKSVAPFKKVTDKALENGDFAIIDFEGFVDGVPFDGGKANGYRIEVGSGTFIPGFEEGMVGMELGMQKDIPVTFPAEYPAPNLAGKKSIFKVTLNDIEVKDISADLDEETIKKLIPGTQNPTKEELVKKVKEQIQREKLNELYAQTVKPSFIDAIIEKISFDLPENIVEQELDMALRKAISQMSQEEIEKAKEDGNVIQNKKEELRADAANSVKLTFIIDELAKANSVEVSDQEVVQAVYFEAFQRGQDPRKYIQTYEKQGLLPVLKMAMIEEKLFTKLFDETIGA